MVSTSKAPSKLNFRELRSFSYVAMKVVSKNLTVTIMYTSICAFTPVPGLTHATYAKKVINRKDH